MENADSNNLGLKIEPVSDKPTQNTPSADNELVKIPEPASGPTISTGVETRSFDLSKNDKPDEKNPGNEKIVLDIGEISEIAPGRGPKPGRPPTGNFMVDIYHRINDYFLEMSRVNIREKMIFYELLSTMIGAGVSLIKALDILSQQTKNERFKKVIWEVANDIEKGSSFSESLSHYSAIFSESEIGMVSSGEAAGRLHEVLMQLANQTEKSATLYARVKGALMYPVMILFILAGALIAMLTMVIPKLKVLFTSSGKELPKATQMLLLASDFMVNHWLILILVVLILVLFFISWKKTESGRYRWDALKLKFPIFGNLYRNIALARFARSLSALLNSGIPIIKALEINANAVGHEVYREKLLLSAVDVSKGIPLGENLSANEDIFPPMVVYMISVGEKTAQIGEMMSKVADYYENEVDSMVQGFMKLIEPMVIAILGVVIGTLVMAIMQPILQLSDITEGV